MNFFPLHQCLPHYGLNFRFNLHEVVNLYEAVTWLIREGDRLIEV